MDNDPKTSPAARSDESWRRSWTTSQDPVWLIKTMLAVRSIAPSETAGMLHSIMTRLQDQYTAQVGNPPLPVLNLQQTIAKVRQTRPDDVAAMVVQTLETALTAGIPPAVLADIVRDNLNPGKPAMVEFLEPESNEKKPLQPEESEALASLDKKWADVMTTGAVPKPEEVLDSLKVLKSRFHAAVAVVKSKGRAHVISAEHGNALPRLEALLKADGELLLLIGIDLIMLGNKNCHIAISSFPHIRKNMVPREDVRAGLYRFITNWKPPTNP